MKNNQQGKTLLEAMLASMLTVTVLLAITSVAQQNQKRFYAENSRIEMQQKARMVLAHLTRYLQSAGSGRNAGFSSAPYTTSSSLPIPRAVVNLIRLRSDYNDDGTISTTIPEDITASWNSSTMTLTIGPTTYDRVNNFVIRFYDRAGNELTPPAGGWDLSTNASHGTILASIARVRLQIEVEAHQIALETKQLQRMTVTSEVTVANQMGL